METKNNEEMITVNGGCFPISWVRKFFNIETADIKDEAVTEAKLDPTLVSEIQQALKGLEITGDDSSGKITVTTTAGDSIDKALPVANAKRAGLMSGSDYAKVQQSVNGVDVSVGTGSGTITVTQNNGTSTKKTVPAATNSAAGLMSAEDKTALGLSFSMGSKTADADKVSLVLTKNDGDIAVVDIDKATEEKAGVMSAEDKTKLDKSVKSITPASTAENVTLTTTNNTGGKSTVGLGAATTSAAGVMTATDKTNLENVKDINSKAIGNTPFIKNASSSGDIYFSAYTVDGTKQDVSKHLITIPLAKAYDGADYSGVMSGADKVKLDGIESGANKYVLPSATDTKIGGVKISSVSGSDTGTAVSQYGVSHILESYAKTAAVPSSGSVSPTATEASIEFNAGSTNLFKVSVPAATTSAAGAMTATDKQQLNNSVSELGLQQGAAQVDISVTKTDGSHVTKTLPGATTDLAGMMTATDKANLYAAVKSVSGVLYGDKIATKYTKTDGSSVELQIPAATTAAAGAMSATDKTNLDALKATVSTMWANILVSEDTRLKFDGEWYDVKKNVPFIIRDWKTFEGSELNGDAQGKFRRFDIHYNGLAKVNRFFVCENVDSKPSIPSLDVSCWDTSDMTSAGYMFCKLANVQSLDVAGFDTSKVENMGGMFVDCASLKSIAVGSWDVSNVKFMDNMFRGCSSLEELEGAEYWSTGNAETMGQMFDGCSSLKSVNASDWHATSKLYNMGGMFHGCASLTDLTFGDNFNTSGVKYMDNMFNGCSSLKALDLSSFQTQSVETMSDMFKDCSSLESLKLGEDFGKMKNSVGTLDLSPLTKWTDETVQTLLTLFDRASHSYGDITIKLSAQTYAVLTTTDIQTLYSRGYSITK
jgi:surface protein